MAMSVKQMQYQLYYLGYCTTENPASMDAVKVCDATKAFQADYKLPVTGAWDVATINKSVEVIKDAQEALNKIAKTSLAVDGLAGGLTKNATKTYQKHVGLPQTGIANDATLKRLADTQEEADKMDKMTDADFWKTIKYFKREEFACKCGKYCNGYPTEPNRLLVQTADKVRAKFGKPMNVSSGVRCKTHNANVGGVSASRHMLGKAMDFKIDGVNPNTILAYIKTLPEIRYAYLIDNDGWIHMDVH